MPRDEMDEAHSRDTRLQNDMRVARAALLMVAEHEHAPSKLVAEALELAERFKKAEDHIVARWN